MKRLAQSFLLLGMLWLPAAAFGANPSDPGGVAGQTQELITVQGGGGLPFTGLDLVLVVVGGLALLATGMLLRRRSGPREGS